MKGICFTEPMFNAAIEKRKTQTRRIAKYSTGTPVTLENCFRILEIIDETSSIKTIKYYAENTMALEIKPRYKKNETVYLKEPYMLFYINDNKIPKIYYKYSEKDREEFENMMGSTKFKWGNKLFMSEKYARYFIKITNVKIEKLQDITEKECIKEGCPKLYDPGNKKHLTEFCSVFDWFKNLWESINGKDSYNQNPYVWVYELELLKSDMPQFCK